VPFTPVNSSLPRPNVGSSPFDSLRVSLTKNLRVVAFENDYKSEIGRLWLNMEWNLHRHKSQIN
jgi:hypothetical protein